MIPEVTCFVRFVSVSCIDLMQEITSEKKDIFLEQVVLLYVERN